MVCHDDFTRVYNICNNNAGDIWMIDILIGCLVLLILAALWWAGKGK